MSLSYGRKAPVFLSTTKYGVNACVSGLRARMRGGSVVPEPPQLNASPESNVQAL